MLKYFGLVCLLVVGSVRCDQRDGNGIDNLHVDGFDGVNKLNIGMIASMPDTGDEATTRVDIWVEENDYTFVYTDDRVTPPSAVHYETCHLLDTNDYFNGQRESGNIQCPLTRLENTTPYGTTITARRLLSTSVVIDAGTLAPSTTCGIQVTATNIFAVVRCQRHIGADHEYDHIFTMVYPINQIIARTLVTGNLGVGMPPKLEITRRWDVTLKLIKQLTTLTQQAYAPTVDDASHDIIPDGGLIELGDSVYVELCLDINANSGFPRYFTANVAPVGAYLYDLVLKYNYVTEGAPVPNNPTLPPSGGYNQVHIIGPDGCPTGSKIWYLGEKDDGYTLEWFPDNDANTLNDKNRAPNVVRTRSMEVSIPSKLFSADVVDIILEAKIGYCTLTTDMQCFWEGDPLNMPTCTARRKRQAVDDDESYGADWPRTVTRQFQIVNPDAGIITEVNVEMQRKKEGCLESTTFIAIACVLGILLLIVFAVALAMFVKIRSYPSDQGSSVEGFHNKAYYN